MLSKRIAISVAAVAVVVALSFVTLPGVDPASLDPLLPRQSVSPMALGVLPFLYASIITSVLCQIFRGLRALRASSAARLATVIGVGLCGLQAFGIASTMVGADTVPMATRGLGAQLTLTASIAGGSALTLVIARGIDAHGVGGGMLLVWGALTLSSLDVASFALPAWVALLGSGIVLGGLLHARRGTAQARSALVEPPGGLFAVVLGGMVLSWIASTALAAGAPFAGFTTQLGLFPSDPRILVLGCGAVAIGGAATALVFTHDATGAKLLGAIRGALVNGATFAVVVVIGWYGLPAAPLAAVLLLLDLGSLRSGALLEIDEHEPKRVVAVLQRLHEGGVNARIGADALVRMMPLIGPLAPIRVVVPPAEHARAMKILAQEAPAVYPPRVLEPRWTSTALAAAVLVAASVGPFVHPKAALRPQTPASTLALFYVDDEVDPMGLIDRGAILVRQERVPLGPGRTELREHLVVEGTMADQRAAIAGQISTILPPDRALLWEREQEGDLVRYRSYVVSTDPIFTSEHVKTARAEPVVGGGRDDWLVAIELTDEGSRRFEDATRRWVKRRIAITVDGEVVAAPVVNGVISGGGLTITPGNDPATNAKEASLRLAAALMGETASSDSER